MKALMLHSENSGVGYYRIWQQAKYLERAGWEVARTPDQLVRLPNDDAIGEASTDPELKKNYEQYGSWESLGRGSDILIFQRPDDPQTLAMALAMRDIYDAPFVFEIDDNVFDVSENSPSYKYWYPGSPLREMAKMFMQDADAITVTTPELADVYREFNSNVFVLPNCQDPEDWESISRPEPEDKIVIGWAGSNTHYDDLKLIARPIKKILRNYPNVVFRILGTLPDFLADVKGVELRKDWVPVQNWYSKLAELNFNIGIAPVVNRPFNQCKSNIKWQEYGMLGIPTIASNVGPYKEIEHRETGLLASNDMEWYSYLEELIKNEQERKRLGSNAKQYVLDNLNIQERIGEWNNVYRTIIEQYKLRKAGSSS